MQNADCYEYRCNSDRESIGADSSDIGFRYDYTIISYAGNTSCLMAEKVFGVKDGNKVRQAIFLIFPCSLFASLERLVLLHGK